MLRHFTAASARRVHILSNKKQIVGLTRHFSVTPPSPPQPPTPEAPKPPNALTKEIAFGIQNATEMFLKHGVGHQKLAEIGNEAGDVETLVSRWQRMMEAFLGTQVHVLAGLGYAPNEGGLHHYNQHVGEFMQNTDPDTQEELRIGTRDLWRTVLMKAFNVSGEELLKSEMEIVEARKVMHAVAMKMQSPDVLEKVAKLAAKTPPTGNIQMDMSMKHQVVQDTLVHDVYLGGEPSLVEEMGFEKGEKGYISMQALMSEHQNDPMIAQYVGASMMQVLKSAGIDPTAAMGQQ